MWLSKPHFVLPPAIFNASRLNYSNGSGIPEYIFKDFLGSLQYFQLQCHHEGDSPVDFCPAGMVKNEDNALMGLLSSVEFKLKNIYSDPDQQYLSCSYHNSDLTLTEHALYYYYNGDLWPTQDLVVDIAGFYDCLSTEYVSEQASYWAYTKSTEGLFFGLLNFGKEHSSTYEKTSELFQPYIRKLDADTIPLWR